MTTLLSVAACMSVATLPGLGQAAPVVPPWQVAAGGKMAFEVASIRRSEPGVGPNANFPLDAGDAFGPVGGRFAARFPLATYIKFAYKLSLTADQIQAMVASSPEWVATDSFDIQARAEGNPTKDQMRLMMQSLLADRFKLVVHSEMREVPELGLTLIKPGKVGPTLRSHADGPSCDDAEQSARPAPPVNGTSSFPPACDVYMLTSKPNGMRLLGSRNTTMDGLAGALSPFSPSRPVVDQTGLPGRFDFTIEWSGAQRDPAAPNADFQPIPQGPTLLEALQDQLGLKVEATKGMVQILVIDHVESPSEN